MIPCMATNNDQGDCRSQEDRSVRTRAFHAACRLSHFRIGIRGEFGQEFVDEGHERR